ncbi:hypothetical protein AAJP47_02090 [Psychrobacter sp. B38]|uniref:META domain-containing protein n=1 Tax=Psychrobacter sp. B38 TaxID=3143538 RepID=UPI00320EC856
MTLHQFYSSASLGILFLTVLTGCQTTNNDTSTPLVIQTSIPVKLEEIINFSQSENNEYISSWKLPELPIERLNRFDWQQVGLIDEDNVVTQIDNEQSLKLDIRPNNLVFKYDCQRYRLHHDGYQNYHYSSYEVTTITTSSCLIKDKQVASDISEYLTQLFPKYGRGRFTLRIIPTSNLPSPLHKLALKNQTSPLLALNTQDKQLIFEGKAKTVKPIFGLPIDYAFLEDYRWRLVSAMDSKQETIEDITRTGYPVTADFSSSLSNLDEHRAGFYSDCNGVGGPYILTSDNILMIGSAPQTMMGCEPKREAAEDKIRSLEQLSKSQLSLKQLPSTSVDDSNLPYYLLTQKLESGETLVWQNEAKRAF